MREEKQVSDEGPSAAESNEMSLTVRFEPIRLAALGPSEDACLGLVDDQLVTVLVRLVECPVGRDTAPWYLETGFVPCQREGLVFQTLAAAERWIRSQVAQRIGIDPQSSVS